MSSDTTPRLGIAVLPPTPAQPQVTHNEALHQIDALTDICLLGQFANTPPASPSDGDTWLLGGAPTGVWSGRAYKLAYCLDGGWRFFAPFNGLRAYVAASRAFLVYQDGSWIDANALISASEVVVASAATCDLGAAGSLFVAITGTVTITGLGTGANLLRLVRFAGALTLTHNAVSLVLPGGASIVTAAGDSAIFSSDASGHWRCRDYVRANGVPACFSGLTGSGLAVGAASPVFSGTIGLPDGGSAGAGGVSASMLKAGLVTGNGGYLRYYGTTAVSAGSAATIASNINNTAGIAVVTINTSGGYQQADLLLLMNGASMVLGSAGALSAGSRGYASVGSQLRLTLTGVSGQVDAVYMGG